MGKHLPSTRMRGSCKGGRWGRGTRIRGHCWREWIMVPAPVGSTQARPQKVIHSHHMDRQYSFWVDNSKELKTGAQKNKHSKNLTHIHSCTTHIPQRWKLKCPRTTHKHNVVHPHHGLPSSHKKELNIETCNKITLKTEQFMDMRILPQ